VSAQPPAVRASDAEREHAVERLRAHAGEGRLTLEELTQRIDAAYSARTRDELERITSDLPAETNAAPLPQRRPQRRAKRLMGVAFGSVERKGRWRLASRCLSIVCFGNADIDLREAQIEGNEASITAFVAFGNMDFYVPEGVEVDHGGFAMFGARGEHGTDVHSPDAAPFLRIRVYTMFGNSDLWRIPAGVRGTYHELIESVRKRELGAG
jgi:hypothetical protein